MPGSSGSHSLAFRVMRLCKPSFHVDNPLLFDPVDLLVGEDILDDQTAAADLSRLLQQHQLTPSSRKSDDPDPTFRSRALLRDPSDATGLSGLLVLPQSFGSIYLGETFCSYISINNSSNFEVRNVIIKAEIQTERQSILLLDSTKSPVESIRAGGRYDFIVEHDVKELGAHTLVCTAVYTDGESERKHLPQFFKFIVSNPLTVRTKVRVVKEVIFLETSIENNTKSSLFMDQVEFQASQHWTAMPLKADESHLQKSSLIREIFKAPVLLKSGGIRNFLFLLRTTMDSQMEIEGSNALGKLQITWRTNLGEPGRLQTQQILGNPITHKEIELNVVDVPSVIVLGKPFTVSFSIANRTDQKMGPFEVRITDRDLEGDRTVYVNGAQSLDLVQQIQANDSISFNLNLVAVLPGIQKIMGITVFDTREKKTYECIDYEIFVRSD